MDTRNTFVALVAVALALVPAASAVHANFSGHYDGPGVIVADFATETIVDNGAVVCDDTDFEDGEATGVGGLCIPFKDAPDSAVAEGPNGVDHVAVEVLDDDVGPEVTFQVCIDNNGDNLCSFQQGEGQAETGKCSDTIRFSHANDGTNHNSLAVRKGFTQGCQDEGGFPGWIVIPCAGEHIGKSGVPHTHHATSGEVALEEPTFPKQSGDFCGAPTAEKAYVVK